MVYSTSVERDLEDLLRVLLLLALEALKKRVDVVDEGAEVEAGYTLLR